MMIQTHVSAWPVTLLLERYFSKVILFVSCCAGTIFASTGKMIKECTASLAEIFVAGVLISFIICQGLERSRLEVYLADSLGIRLADLTHSYDDHQGHYQDSFVEVKDRCWKGNSNSHAFIPILWDKALTNPIRAAVH